MIDHDKLSRLEDQHAALVGARTAIFERYRQRVETAKELLHVALLDAYPALRNLNLGQLADYSDERLVELGVRVKELNAARREFAAATRLYREFEASKPETNASHRLLGALRAHAFPMQSGNQWSLR